MVRKQNVQNTSKVSWLKMMIVIAVALGAAAFFLWPDNNQKEESLHETPHEAIPKNNSEFQEQTPTNDVSAHSSQVTTETSNSAVVIKNALQAKVSELCLQGKTHPMEKLDEELRKLNLSYQSDLVNLHFMHQGKRYTLQWNEEEDENGAVQSSVTFFVLDREDFPTKVKPPFEIKEVKDISKIKAELKRRVGKIILHNEMGELDLDSMGVGRYEITNGKFVKIDLDELNCEGSTCRCLN